MATVDIQTVLEHRAQVEAFQRKHRIGLLTLLFTDIVGSTSIKQNLGDAEGFDRIQAHHAVVREFLKRFPEGEEISTAGDSFFLVFAKPSEAVKFALLLQSRLRETAQASGVGVFDRIGIHIGEVIIDEQAGAAKPKDLYGMQVDLCARVMSAGDGDQILMTRSAFDNARQVLKGKDVAELRNLVWLNHGPYVIQGADEPLEICEVGEEGLARLRPPADSGKVRRFISAGSLATEPKRFTGSHSWRWVAAGAAILLVVAVAVGAVLRSRNTSSGPAAQTAAAPSTVVERTGFEAAEGFTAGQPLIGQKDWKRGNWPGQLAEGGQGVAAGLFGGSAQQAFIGGAPGATEPGMHCAVRRPLAYTPAPGKGSVEIGWKQLIKPSSDGVGNLFEWLAYDQRGRLLCGIVFDNSTRHIARRFHDNALAKTPFTFKDGEVVEVKLRLDLQQNRWSASIGPHNLPPRQMGPENRASDLGGIALTWRSVAGNARTPGGPVAGDNVLAFDDLVVTAFHE